jgi:hypothetical protein
MNDKFQSILDSLPEKPPRSRLAPYYELIEELRLRGSTYREIERILVDQCQFQISRSAINNFMRTQARKKADLSKRKTVEPAAKNTEAQIAATETKIGPNTRMDTLNRKDRPMDDILHRIAELKKRPAQVEMNPKQFHYDPNEPLHLPIKKENQ